MVWLPISQRAMVVRLSIAAAIAKAAGVWIRGYLSMFEKRKMFQTGLIPPFLPRNILNKERAGFTLIELIVVLIIVAVLAGLAIPNYARTREKALDREAQSALRLIQAAERVYQSKAGIYLGILTGIDAVNSNLQLDLASSSWNFSVTAAPAGPPPAFTATAVRSPSSSRTWSINQDTSANLTCAPAVSCF